jgi:hypothetical protein
MPDPYIDLAKLAVPALIGAIGGYSIKFWEVWRQQQKLIADTWTAQKSSHWSPLLRATSNLESRFIYLKQIFERREPIPFSPESLSADFRELYMLSPDEIPNLEHVDANLARQDAAAVQRARTRVCHQLTFAESSVYIIAVYLAHAEHVWRALTDDALSIPAKHASHLLSLLHNVRQALQGKSGAGIFLEQQEYIGQALLLPGNAVVSNIDFRRTLFAMPGWEVFSNLLRFFAEFPPKVPYEVTSTIKELAVLRHALTQLRDAASRQEYGKQRLR